MTEQTLEMTDRETFRKELERFIEWSGAVGEALENFKTAIGRLQDEDRNQWGEIREIHKILRECRERCSKLSDCKAPKSIVEKLDAELSSIKNQIRKELKDLENKFDDALGRLRETHDHDLETLKTKYEGSLKELTNDQVSLKITKARIYTRLAFTGMIGGALFSMLVYLLKHLFEIWRKTPL